MEPKAFIVVGHASSGTRFVSRMFLNAGCLGDSGFDQPFDKELPSPDKPIVWKTHNVSPKEKAGTIHLNTCVERSIEAGYEPIVIVVHRDVYANVASSLTRGYADDNRLLYRNCKQWYINLYKLLDKLKCNWFPISYDALSVYGDDYVREIEKFIPFKFNKHNYPVMKTGSISRRGSR